MFPSMRIILRHLVATIDVVHCLKYVSVEFDWKQCMQSSRCSECRVILLISVSRLRIILLIIIVRRCMLKIKIGHDSH